MPLLPPAGRRAERLRRRAIGIAAETFGFLLATALLPLLLLVAGVADLALWLRRRKPATGVRLVLVLWWFLLGEVVALLRLAWLWLRAGGPRGVGGERRRKGVYDLRTWWARRVLMAARVLFGLRIEVRGLETTAESPYLFMIRHASILDNLLADSLVAHPQGLGIRYVVKRELEVIPPIDIGGRWIPTVFLQRASGDSATEIERLRTIARDLGRGEFVAIYPEGTRHTDAKLARVKEVLRERDPELAELAEPLRNVLPPRVGGPLALIEETEGVDVVFCAHVGFDGFERLGDIWAGGLVGRTIRVELWRVPAAEVPRDREARIRWLFGQWQRVDDWVEEQRRELGQLPAGEERTPAAV